MNQTFVLFLAGLLFLVAVLVASNSGYEQGFYDGLREFCPLGDINVYPNNDIRCDMPLNDSYEVIPYEFKI